MSAFSSRRESIDRGLIPALRALGFDTDELDVEGIGDATVRMDRRGPGPGVEAWQHNHEGEALRRLAEQHPRR